MNRDWLEKDFYKTLEVSKDSSDDQIKKSYRKLAQKLHPDANPGDDGAADRFKEVSEAYSVLSDDDKRKEYDQVRSLGPGGFGRAGRGQYQNFSGQQVRIEDLLGGGVGDLFEFGGAGSRRAGPQRGSDVGAVLELSFVDSIRGTTTAVNLEGDTACSRCRGNGAEPGTPVDVCPTCAGTGNVSSNQGFFSFTNPCPTCRGSGRQVTTPCSNCGGAGTERRTRTINVKIPAGVKEGGTIRLRGKGSPGLRGGPSGDLLVKLRVARHPVFSRKGDNITMKLPLAFTEAALGAKVEIPTLNGPVTLKIPSGTPSGKTFRVRKEGVQRARGRPGDLLVTVEVTVPEKLPKTAKKMLEEFRDLYEDGNPRSNLAV